MSVYVIVQGRIENRGLLDRYVAKAGPAIKSHQGGTIAFDEAIPSQDRDRQHNQRDGTTSESGCESLDREEDEARHARQHGGHRAGVSDPRLKSRAAIRACSAGQGPASPR